MAVAGGANTELPSNQMLCCIICQDAELVYCVDVQTMTFPRKLMSTIYIRSVIYSVHEYIKQY